MGNSRQREPSAHPQTPDGRYMVVRGRLWRLSNPALDAGTRQQWVLKLMAARRDVRVASGDPQLLALARAAVNQAKIALGERGPVWWNDGTPDHNRRMVINTPYADWFRALDARPGQDPATACHPGHELP